MNYAPFLPNQEKCYTNQGKRVGNGPGWRSLYHWKYFSVSRLRAPGLNFV